jgi:uncharacterized protein
VKKSALSLLTACLLGQAVLLHGAFQVPPLMGPVNDQAGMLSPETTRRLDQALRALWQNRGSQLAVLTVGSLEGEPIESASIKVVEAWKLGTAKADNGVLLMISKADRKIRIEVGQGLEGELTDLYCSRIIRGQMAPRMRQGDVDGAVLAAVAAILEKTDPNGSKAQGLSAPAEASNSILEGAQLLAFLLFFGIFGVFLFISRKFGGRGRGGWGGGGWGGGGGSWGGGGGGGFSGGGGGFSGGGSSGGW